MKVRDKVFVVTGAGNGMGRELTLGLLERGARVAAVDIRQESLDKTAELADAGNSLATFVVDVTDRSAIEALPDQVTAALGTVDGLINNAGIIQPFVKIAELDYDTIDRVMNVNLFGQIHMVKAFLPMLMDRPEAHIANVSSMGGFLPVPGQTIYGASKAAVKLFTEGLYAELMDTTVHISLVFPGALMTDITANSGVETPAMSEKDMQKATSRSLDPHEAAKITLDGIERDRFHIYVGRDSRMMNLANRFAPKRSTHLISRQMENLLD